MEIRASLALVRVLPGAIGIFERCTVTRRMYIKFFLFDWTPKKWVGLECSTRKRKLQWTVDPHTPPFSLVAD